MRFLIPLAPKSNQQERHAPMKSLISLVLSIVLGLPLTLTAQTTSSQQDNDVIRTRTNEVKLDVVVKDKKGRPVKDLNLSDFEVFEDGVKQKVQSFRFVSTQGGRTPQPAVQPSEAAITTPSTITSTTTPQPTRSTPSVTALVFDRLS